MNTVSITPTTATTELNDTIVALEGLHDGFQTILQQAVDQLANLELNQEQLDKVKTEVCTDSRFRNLIAEKVSCHIISDLYDDAEESVALRHLENHLTTVIWSRIERNIKDRIAESLANYDFADHIGYELRRHDRFQKTRRQNQVVNDMVNMIAHKLIELNPETDVEGNSN